jgi:hypothetical protein
MSSHTNSIKAFPGRVVFDHLPKTAGQAINFWLREALGSGCVTPNLIGAHRELIQQYGGLYSIISAHVEFNYGEGLDPRYRYMTLFREPIDRAVSWVFYVLNDVGTINETLPLKQGAKEFVESDGSETNAEFLNSISNPYTEHFSRIEGTALATEREKVETAFAAIQKYDVVGLYSDMAQFLSEVGQLIDIAPPNAIGRVNVTSKRPNVEEVSPRLRERIISLNQLDIELYEKVMAWKESTASHAVTKNMTTSLPIWEKYETLENRVFVSPEFTLLASTLREGYEIRHGQLMTFDIDFCLQRDIHDLETGIHIFDSQRRVAFGTNSTLLEKKNHLVPRGSYRVSHHLIADLPSGKYTAGFAFAERLPNGQLELSWHDVLCEFQVHHSANKPFAGYAYLPAQIGLFPACVTVEDFGTTSSKSG